MMNEKQRWLLRELDAWIVKQQEAIGKYSPKKKAAEPVHIRRARRTIAVLNRTIERWQKRTQRDPWERQRAVIAKKYQTVKRVILFEKVEVALKALKSIGA